MKKQALILPIVGAVLSSPLNAYAQGEKQRPNVIILTADDLGWNDISSPITTEGSGSKNHQTPNIDRLITQGVSFTNSYTQQNSAPTRAALLTGQYANNTGVYNVTSLTRYGTAKKGGITEKEALITPPDQNNSILPSTVTLAETLHEGGYETYIFGKVHGWNGDLTDDHGFTHNYECSKAVSEGGEKVSNYFAHQKQSGEWVFASESYNKYADPYTEEYVKEKLLPFANGNDPMTIVGREKHFTDAIGDMVVDQIAELDPDQPAMMWICFHAIHSGIVAREDLYDKYKSRTKLDERHKNYKYAALTEQLDQTVGRILAALDDPNGDGDTSDSISENTLVIFMSDNGGVGGDHSNAPLRESKGTFYEGGIRVPFVARYPALIEPNRVSCEPIHVIDYYPTIAQATGCELPAEQTHKLDGESFLPILTGESKELKRDALYWHFPGYMDSRQQPTSVINKRVGNERYKLRYYYESESYELYNLTKDGSESQDLMVDITKQNQKIAGQLRADLCEWLIKNPPMTMRYKATGEAVGLPQRIAK
ncbi:MAG: sulfatase-like hydrolase/transferase [Rikenellaceae bacterium]